MTDATNPRRNHEVRFANFLLLLPLLSDLFDPDRDSDDEGSVIESLDMDDPVYRVIDLEGTYGEEEDAFNIRETCMTLLRGIGKTLIACLWYVVSI